MTASKSGENSVGVASNENSNSDANENEEEESKATDCSGYESSKKVLILKSPMGAKSALYNWPLKKGKGSLRRSEDKEDEAGEIIETIRWVCEDVQSIKDAMEISGVLSKYDPKSYDSMLELCKTYNKSVDAHLKDRSSTLSDSKLTRCSKLHLKHILQKCYNKSVIDPNELNNYEAFTPEVYGETSFELICQILDKLHPIGRENKFVDLGSGVGQVVLQVAALTNCSMSLGIEKANTPAKYAEQYKDHFIFWMNFHGKEVSPFKLMKGDFLNPLYYEEIKECSIIFVNNYVFGPVYDQRLKEIFSEMQDGSRIFSSKSFCPTNFRTNNRNLNDIGTIMHVSKMDPLKGSVSWTGRPVSYYLHVIDRAKLERYFQKTAARKGEKGSRRGGGVWTDASRGPSEDDDEMTSSPSGIHGRPPVSDKDNLPHRRFGRLSKQRGKRAKRNTKKSLKKRHNILGISSIEESDNFSSARLHNDDYELDRIGTPPTDSNSSSPPHTSDNTGTPNRPIRAVVANAVAISEAQHEKSAIKKRGRKRLLISPSDMKIKGKLNALAGLNISNHEEKKMTNCKRTKISGLDLLHKTTMESINASEVDLAVPQGCVYERLTKNAPNKLIHEELPISINIEQNNPAQLPFSLQAHLERCKRQYLDFMRHMEDPIFKNRLTSDLLLEKERNQELLRREIRSKKQIQNLIEESIKLLKCKLNALGIRATTYDEYYNRATNIVCRHDSLKAGKYYIEKQMLDIEAEQERIIEEKQKKLLEKIWSSGVSYKEAQHIINRQISKALKTFGWDNETYDNPIAKLLDMNEMDRKQLSSSNEEASEEDMTCDSEIDSPIDAVSPRDSINRTKDNSILIQDPTIDTESPDVQLKQVVNFVKSPFSLPPQTTRKRLSSKKTNIDEVPNVISKEPSCISPTQNLRLLKRLSDTNREGNYWKIEEILN